MTKIIKSIQISHKITAKEAAHYQHGLFSPEGDFYPCGYMGHNNLEYDLTEILLIPWYHKTDRCLDINKAGWVKLSSEEIQVYSNVLPINEFGVRQPMPKIQKQAIIEYLLATGKEEFGYGWSKKTLNELLSDINDIDRYVGEIHKDWEYEGDFYHYPLICLKCHNETQVNVISPVNGEDIYDLSLKYKQYVDNGGCSKCGCDVVFIKNRDKGGEIYSKNSCCMQWSELNEIDINKYIK